VTKVSELKVKNSSQQSFYGQTIAVEAEAADDTAAGSADAAVVAELLALVDIGDVYLYDRRRDGTDSIVEGDAGVGVGTRVEHNAVGRESHLMELVDEGALVVALEIGELHVGVLLAQFFKVCFKGASAVDARLAATQKIEVGTVENKD
jgi:hypothetical protein